MKKSKFKDPANVYNFDDNKKPYGVGVGVGKKRKYER
jgi:hypothetical protein